MFSKFLKSPCRFFRVMKIAGVAIPLFLFAILYPRLAIFFFSIEGGSVNPVGEFTAKILIPIIGGIIAIFALLAANRRSDAHMLQAKTGHDLNKSNQLSSGIEHLGSDNDQIVLGGIYELFDLAQKSDEYRNFVFKLFCGYVREKTNKSEYQKERLRLAEKTHVYLEYPQDPEYRIYSSTTPSYAVNAILDLLFRGESHNVFKGYCADLKYAWLPGADLFGMHLPCADLWRTWLPFARFDEAHLEGASLYEAKLQYAYFRKSHLSFACLDKATFEFEITNNGTHHQPRLEKCNLKGILNAEKYNFLRSSFDSKSENFNAGFDMNTFVNRYSGVKSLVFPGLGDDMDVDERIRFLTQQHGAICEIINPDEDMRHPYKIVSSIWSLK